MKAQPQRDACARFELVRHIRVRIARESLTHAGRHDGNDLKREATHDLLSACDCALSHVRSMRIPRAQQSAAHVYTHGKYVWRHL